MSSNLYVLLSSNLDMFNTHKIQDPSLFNTIASFLDDFLYRGTLIYKMYDGQYTCSSGPVKICANAYPDYRWYSSSYNSDFSDYVIAIGVRKNKFKIFQYREGTCNICDPWIEIYEGLSKSKIKKSIDYMIQTVRDIDNPVKYFRIKYNSFPYHINPEDENDEQEFFLNFAESLKTFISNVRKGKIIERI